MIGLLFVYVFYIYKKSRKQLINRFKLKKKKYSGLLVPLCEKNVRFYVIWLNLE